VEKCAVNINICLRLPDELQDHEQLHYVGLNTVRSRREFHTSDYKDDIIVTVP
jgi:hypothetical protein